MESELFVEHFKTWEDKDVVGEAQGNIRDEHGHFNYCRDRDVLGDRLDDISGDVSSELKAIAIWGGPTILKPVLMAYNDFKCADAIMSAIKGPVSDEQLAYLHTLQFAKLIAANRASLIASKQLKKVDVTQQERRNAALHRYKDRSFFLRHPPKRVHDVISKRLGGYQECDDRKRSKAQKTLKDIASLKWDKKLGLFVSDNQFLNESSILSDVNDIYKTVCDQCAE